MQASGVRSVRTGGLCLAPIALLWTACGSPAPAEEADPMLAEMGSVYYARHCAACHGEQGQGDGPAAPALATAPPDLTQIAARRGGEFPDAEISRFIDGRLPVQAHGRREMPIWGERLGEAIPETEVAESVVRGKVVMLVEYLKSIQRPAPEARQKTPPPEEVRAIMGEVFAALRQVLPASLDEERFSDPARRGEIQAALSTLARHADALSVHRAARDPGFAFLSGSLARDAREIEGRYASGRFQEAAFSLQQMTEDCVACHSRLPSDDSELSERFLADVRIEALPLPERARLAMATRNFDAGLEAHEAMLASPEVDPAYLDLDGHLHDYLEIALRVRRDFERPARALEGFAARKDLPAALRSDVKGWIEDLGRPALRELSGFEDARSAVEEAEAGGLDARTLLVRYVCASGAFHRQLEAGSAANARGAETYYWLGVIESRVGRSFWLSQTEPYLEAAIRLDPGGPRAEAAFERLEEFVVSGYSGSGGEQVPPEVQSWLDELSFLIDAARARPSAQRAG